MPSQLEQLCKTLKITAKSKRGAHGCAPFDMPLGSKDWRVTLHFDKRSVTTNYYTGPRIVGDPTPADVLSSLIIDMSVGETSFDDFCDEFAVDRDNKRQESLHKKCVRMAPKVRRFLGEHFTQLVNAQH